MIFRQWQQVRKGFRGFKVRPEVRVRKGPRDCKVCADFRGTKASKEIKETKEFRVRQGRRVRWGSRAQSRGQRVQRVHSGQGQRDHRAASRVLPAQQDLEEIKDFRVLKVSKGLKVSKVRREMMEIRVQSDRRVHRENKGLMAPRVLMSTRLRRLRTGPLLFLEQFHRPSIGWLRHCIR